MVSSREHVTIVGHEGTAVTGLKNLLLNPIGSNAERVIAVLVFAFLLCIRQPLILSEGRFWAEEGQIFFARAWTLPWYQALLLPDAGYLNITANVATLLARYLVPLRAAPYVTTGIALAVQCIPAVIIVTSRATWLQQRLVGATALVIIAEIPYSFDGLLNSIHSQFYLALAAALILSLEPRRGVLGAVHVFVIGLAALSGPACWALLPLFAARAALERSSARLVQTIALTVGVLLQILFFYSAFPGRSIGVAPTLFGAIAFAKHVVGPLLYSKWADAVIRSFAPAFTEAGGPVWPLLAVTIVAAALFGAFARFWKESPLWLFSSGAAMAAIGYMGALDKTKLISFLPGARYALAPQILFALALLSWSVISRSALRNAAVIVVFWSIAIDVLDYRLVQWGPSSWPQEVQRWQQDKSYALKIWPDGWTMTLPPK